MAEQDFRPFLRLQTDSWLTAAKTAVAAAITANSEFVSLSMGGKAMGKQREVRTVDYARQLADVLIERGLQGSDYTAPTRMTVARFA